MKNLCACNCGTRINPRNNRGWRSKTVGHFAPGHDDRRREVLERVPYRGKKYPLQVQLYEGRIPTALNRRQRGKVHDNTF
jgi:hypothetical protein